MTWKIIYFDTELHNEIKALPKLFYARFLHLTDRMEEVGPNLGMPHTCAMGDGLFELRIKAAPGIARIFFCTRKNKQIIFLHSFIKKKQKTPKKELKIAYARLREVENETN